MKKTTKLDKLALKPETIRPLTSDDLKRVAGGAFTQADTERYSCTCATCSDR